MAWFVAAFFFLLLTASTRAHTISAAYHAHDPAPSQMAVASNNIKHDIHINANHYYSDRQKQVLALAEQYAGATSCNKLAAKSLLDDCSGLGLSSSEPRLGMTLEDIKSVYAARLAICELREGSSGIAIPKACSSFVPRSEKSAKIWRNYLTSTDPTEPQHLDAAYEDATASDVEQCVAALHKTGTGWTSYSNNKQNAVTMCHAVRDEIERDNTLELLKSFVKVTDASLADVTVTQQQLQIMKEDFGKLSNAMQKLMVSLYEGERERQSEIEQAWKEVLNGFHKGMHDMSTTVQQNQDQLVVQGDLIDLNNAKIKEAAAQALEQVHGVGIVAQKNAQAASDAVGTLSDGVQFAVESMFTQLHQELMRMNYTIQDSAKGALLILNKVDQSAGGALQHILKALEGSTALDSAMVTMRDTATETDIKMRATKRAADELTDSLQLLISLSKKFNLQEIGKFAVHLLLSWLLAYFFFHLWDEAIKIDKTPVHVMGALVFVLFACFGGPIDWYIWSHTYEIRSIVPIAQYSWTWMLIAALVVVAVALFACFGLWILRARSRTSTSVVQPTRLGSRSEALKHQTKFPSIASFMSSNAAEKYTPEDAKQRHQDFERLKLAYGDEMELATDGMTDEQAHAFARSCNVFAV